MNIAAFEFLQERLKDGPVLATTMHGEGAAHGFSRGTLLRAGRHLGMEYEKTQGTRDGAWYWKLPEHPPELLVEPIEKPKPVEINGKTIYPDRKYRLPSGRVITGASYIKLKSKR